MSEKGHILVVDDDERIRRTVSYYLETEGFHVGAVGDGQAMWDYLEDESPDIILLDVMLPGADGFSLAQKLSTNTRIGVIIVTGKKDPVDTVVGLEIGADDYMTKPFNNRELLARIHSLLRRLSSKNSEETGLPQEQKDKVASFEDWKLNLFTYELLSPECKPVHLTTHEFNLLSIFVHNAGHVLTRDQISKKLSNREWSPDDRSIDVLVGRLRKVMQQSPSDSKLIHTVRNAGYQFMAKVTFSYS